MDSSQTNKRPTDWTVKNWKNKGMEELGWQKSALASGYGTDKYFLKGTLKEDEISGIWLSYDLGGYLTIVDMTGEYHIVLYQGPVRDNEHLKLIMIKNNIYERVDKRV